MTGSTFYRTDGNAVFLDAYNRNATVTDCEFAYIGMSAVVTFGATQQEDATVGTQPWGTVLAYNLVHELGAYQLQSSAWFTSRAALTRAEGLVVFNIPRAAINFNDGEFSFTPHSSFCVLSDRLPSSHPYLSPAQAAAAETMSRR